MSIREPDNTDPNNIIYQIKSNLDQFRLSNPLEYVEIFNRPPIVADPDTINLGRTIILQYKDNKLFNGSGKPMIHNLSLLNFKTINEEITKIIVYYNHNSELEVSNITYELRETIRRKNYPNDSMTVDYFFNNLLSKYFPKLKYQQDKCFKNIIDILKSK